MPKSFVRLNKHGYTKLYGFKSQTKFTFVAFHTLKNGFAGQLTPKTPYCLAAKFENSVTLGIQL